jgi:hypothetical protein
VSDGAILSLIMDAEVRVDGWRSSRDANFVHVTLILRDIGPVLDALKRGHPQPTASSDPQGAGGAIGEPGPSSSVEPTATTIEEAR